MEIPAINLKAIVLVHWLLTVWGCMAWLPPSYAWSNFSVLAVGVWAIAQRDSIDAVLMFLIGFAVTILTDIVHFGIYYPVTEGLSERNRDTFRFSAGMAILGLLLKPVSCFFIYQMYRERGGDYNVNFAGLPRQETEMRTSPLTRPPAHPTRLTPPSLEQRTPTERQHSTHFILLEMHGFMKESITSVMFLLNVFQSQFSLPFIWVSEM